MKDDMELTLRLCADCSAMITPIKKAENSRLSENLKDEIINRKFLELKNKNLEAKKHKPKTYKGKNLKEAFEDLRKDLMIWS